MSDETLCRQFTKAELIDEAKGFCVRTYGPVLGSQEPDKWHERYGVFCDFIDSLYEWRGAPPND